MKSRVFLIWMLLISCSVSANPIFVDSYVSVLKEPILDDLRIKGVVGFKLNEGIGIFDGLIVAELVYSPENKTLPNGFVQEWVVKREIIANLTSSDNQTYVDLVIEVPDYAPSGNYRLDIYFRSGRRYISSYYPSKDTIARYYFEITNPLSYDVPVLDLLKTNANGLQGSLGPFVDDDKVPLEIWLTDHSSPVNAMVTACPWDDTATVIGARDKRCFAKEYYSQESPLNVEFPLPSPGAYGIRVESLYKGKVTSTAVLRAVRNGTSPRIVELLPHKNADGLFLKAILTPNADNSPNGENMFEITMKDRNELIFEKELEIVFGEPVDFNENADRSVEVLVPVNRFPLWYVVSAKLYENGILMDEFMRASDVCAERGFCCLEGISDWDIRSVPKIK